MTFYESQILRDRASAKTFFIIIKDTELTGRDAGIAVIEMHAPRIPDLHPRRPQALAVS